MTREQFVAAILQGGNYATGQYDLDPGVDENEALLEVYRIRGTRISFKPWPENPGYPVDSKVGHGS